MANIPGSIPVTGKIAPTDTADVFATHESQYGIGDKHVLDIAARDLVTEERRVWGMLCHTETDSYQLVKGLVDADITNNLNWKDVEFTSSTLTIGPGSVNYLSLVAGVLDVTALAVTGVTTGAEADLATWIAANYTIGTELQEGDVLILTTPSEVYIHNGGTAISAADFTSIEVPQLTDTYIRNLLSATGPLSYNPVTGDFTIAQANGTTDGYLSMTDWSTFNDKLGSFTELDPVFTASPAANVVDNLASNVFLAGDGTYQSAGGASIYTADGTLTGNRTVTLDGNNLTFDLPTFSGTATDEGLFIDGSNFEATNPGAATDVFNTTNNIGKTFQVFHRGGFNSLSDYAALGRIWNRAATKGLELTEVDSEHSGSEMLFNFNRNDNKGVVIRNDGASKAELFIRDSSDAIHHWIRQGSTSRVIFFRQGITDTGFIVGGSAKLGTEQISLQGTTRIGDDLQVDGTITIIDGSQGVGKVLTSDAAGLATWQAAGGGDGIYGGSGSLSGVTAVAMGGSNLNFTSTGGSITYDVGAVNSQGIVIKNGSQNLMNLWASDAGKSSAITMFDTDISPTVPTVAISGNRGSINTLVNSTEFGKAHTGGVNVTLYATGVNQGFRVYDRVLDSDIGGMYKHNSTTARIVLGAIGSPLVNITGAIGSPLISTEQVSF